MRFRYLAAILAALTSAPAWGAEPATTGTPYPGVEYARYDLEAPTARVHVIAVDLSSSEIDLVATPEADKGRTVSAFATASATQVVVNGDFFDPDGYRPAGLARGDSLDWSLTADDARAGVLSFFRGPERTELAISPPEEVLDDEPPLDARIVGAVSGRPMLVRAGSATGAADCTDLVALPCLAAPRTAAALSADGNTLWLVVVDGWQAGSVGLTAIELADFLVDLGAHDALMLDGGSASSLHVTAMGGLVSSPSDGVARPVANHLAVRHGALEPGELRGVVRERNIDGAALSARVKLDDGRIFNYNGVDQWHFEVAPRYACATATKAGYAPATECRQVISQETVFGSIFLFPLAEVPDAAPTPPDAATPVDAGDGEEPSDGGAGATDAGPGPDDPPGCGCRTASPGGLAGLLVALALLLRRDRRKHGNTPEDVETQLYTDAATGELFERQFRLLVIGGPDKGLEKPLELGTTMIGTHPNNQVVLTDDTVSRYHLELQLRRDGLKLTDLDSTNGTFHGDARVGSLTLAGPTRLRLGKHTLVELAPVDVSVSLADWSDEKYGRVVGNSPVMRQLFALLARVAPTDVTLLIEGETGTGKEAIAEAVHLTSLRAHAPMTVVDCAAIPANLIGSELFGHVKGAFTGATHDKEGLIRAADGGTLFLDEIGELSLELQPQLLRVLEKREVRRIGDTHARKIDIRVVAATNRNLKEMVKAGTFREDLYYRLAVVRAVVPPLRERPDDVVLLAHHFADQLGAPFELSPSLIHDLRRHAWPGNVRELRNVVERALSLGRSGVVPQVDDLVSSAHGRLAASDAGAGGGSGAAPRAVGGGTSEEVLDLPFKEAKGLLIEGFERDYLTHLLAKHRGNISRAASEAGIDRNYIHRLVKKYGIPVDRG